MAARLREHAGIEVNLGKTKVWNLAGEEPGDMRDIAREHDPAARVWVGDQALPPEEQGLLVLGTPLGAEEFVQGDRRSEADVEDFFSDYG